MFVAFDGHHQWCFSFTVERVYDSTYFFWPTVKNNILKLNLIFRSLK